MARQVGEKSDGKSQAPVTARASPVKARAASRRAKASQSDSQGQGKGQQGQGQGQGQDRGKDKDKDRARIKTIRRQQAQDANNPPQEQNPVRKRLEAAKEHMEKAKKRLEKAKKEGAVEEQEKALRELDTAKAELEDILRQLREEEMKRLLAMLEARFLKVLQIQREIYAGTVRLDKIPVVERSHAYEIDTGRLSNREAEIVTEVEKALSLLREEGSSVAMPEAVQQVRDDMQQLVHRLAEGKTEVLTQAIETDVIKALGRDCRCLEEGAEGRGEQEEAARTLAQRPAAGSAPDRAACRVEDDPRPANAREPPHRALFEAHRRRAGQQGRRPGGLAAPCEQQARVYKVTRELELGKNE